VLKAQAGIDLVHIPYAGGGPALASILSGVTEVYGSPYATAKPFVEDGKLVGLAVTSAERIPFIPDMPTVAETLPGYEVTTGPEPVQVFAFQTFMPVPVLLEP